MNILIMYIVHLLKTDSDDIIWLRLSKVLFDSEEDIYVCLSYIVPEGSSREHLTENSVYNRVLADMAKISSDTDGLCSFIFLGDMNSRVGHLSDYIENDDPDPSVHVLPDDYVSDTPLPRASQDYIVNQNGRSLIEFCKESGLRIANGRVGGDAVIGKYTFTGTQGKSLIDYVISSQCLLNRFSSFYIDDPNILSDHCAVNFSLKTQLVRGENANIGHGTAPNNIHFIYKWDNAKTQLYQSKLNEDSF